MILLVFPLAIVATKITLHDMQLFNLIHWWFHKYILLLKQLMNLSKSFVEIK